MPEEISQRFCGYCGNREEIVEIREIVSSCHGIIRTELASGSSKFLNLKVVP